MEYEIQKQQVKNQKYNFNKFRDQKFLGSVSRNRLLIVFRSFLCHFAAWGGVRVGGGMGRGVISIKMCHIADLP